MATAPERESAPATHNGSPAGSLTRIGADIGGTFTDIAVVDADGTLRVGKRLTSHGAEDDAVVAALADTGLDLSASEAVLAHGHTLVINALLERKGARVGFVTTEGFSDVIEMHRGSRPEIYNLRYRRDPILVEPKLRFEVSERVYASGEIARRPTTEELNALVEELRKNKVEAVAIGFFNSYVQPENERVVAEHLRRALPGIPVSISSDISRQWREFERFTTATANAYVAPVADRYVKRLLDGLSARRFKGDFVVLDSAGGALGVEAAQSFPVRTVESGPVAGVIGARELARSLSIENMVTFDMGGTTAKSCLIEGGRFASTEVVWIGGYERGFPLQIRCVDVTEVGAGGGSIAWIDDAGRLRVGPRSAGSIPGPASYGLGGTEPTVTDADLYCGRVDKDNFVGALKLDPAAATEAIERLAVRLDLDPRRLALGILKLANLSMAAAVRRQTLERGRDPREFSLAAFGGAGPMHACEVAAEVGIGHVVIPPFPGHFSAIGMLGVNLRVDRREVFRGLLGTMSAERLRQILARVTDELGAELRFGHGGVPGAPSEIVFSYSLALRYKGQDHTLLIPSPEPGLRVAEDLADVFRTRFDAEYLQRYGHLDDEAEVEVVEVEVVGERLVPSVEIGRSEQTLGDTSTITSFFGLGESGISTDVVPRGSLGEGSSFEGPLIVYEEGATTVVPPHAKGRVGANGNLLIDVGSLVAS
jgi:N-methylhydantoinase A